MTIQQTNTGTAPRSQSLHAGTDPLWGDLSRFSLESKLPATLADEMLLDEDALWNFSEPKESTCDDDVVVTPSATEIEMLLSQLGCGSVPLSHAGPHCDRVTLSRSKTASLYRLVQSLDPELREAFLDDASRCIDSVHRALLHLESDPQHADSLNQIRRELHTLKGAAASVKLSDLADHLHQLEDDFQADCDAGKPPQIRDLLRSMEEIQSQIAPLSLTVRGKNQQTVPLRGHWPRFQIGDESQSVPKSAWNVDLSADALDNETVRVQASQLNRVTELIAELAVHDCKQAAPSELSKRIRHELMQLSRAPISELLQRLQRVVDETAQAEGKNVRLELIGQDAKIERWLQQRLYEPLLHIVRNCVCHGIETPQQRCQVNKPPVGTITLEAKLDHKRLVIEICDDGRGLDYDAIRRRGIELGLLAAGENARREELAQLILSPGLSTRHAIDQVAGRGIGMDVVATAVQRLRGSLRVDSEPHQGTRIRLSFSTISQIQSVLLFRCAGQTFALPMHTILSAADSSIADGNAVEIDFSVLLGYRHNDLVQPRQRVQLGCHWPTVPPSGHDVKRMTLLVDEILGPDEVIVRPLPPLLAHHPFCAGAALSAGGKLVLVVDTERCLVS